MDLLGGDHPAAGTVDAEHDGLDAGIVPELPQFLDRLAGVDNDPLDPHDRDFFAAGPNAVQHGQHDAGGGRDPRNRQNGPEYALLLQSARYSSSSPSCFLFLRAARPRD